MRLGIHLPQYGRAASADAIRQIAVRAEEIGLADVWVSDHLVFPADQGYPASFLFDPLLTLGWAASATQRIGLGTSVMVVPQVSPASFGQQPGQPRPAERRSPDRWHRCRMVGG